MGGILVELDDKDHLEVINYRLSINPPLDSFDPRIALKENVQLLTGLRPGTEYRLELIAVLSTGAETDLVETAFNTLGTSSAFSLTQSDCALSHESLSAQSQELSSCDFEGGTLCGWSQPRAVN